MTASATQTTRLEDTLGIRTISDNLKRLATLGEQFVANAPLGKKPCCAWDAGSLSRKPGPDQATPHVTLLLDMGGTHTKVGYRDTEGSWIPVLDHHNDWFESKRDSSLPLLQGFFRTLLSETVDAAAFLKTSTLPIRMGVIWSNQIKTKRFQSGKTRGVTGLVHGFQSGGYRKGEWFLKQIKNGDDIGAALLAECEHAGLTPEVMVLGNDTLFTLFAVEDAHAGVVMSSGGNCTLVGTEGADKDELFNSELGGMFMLPPELLSVGDLAFAKSRGVASLSLEELAAGNWLSAMVTAHILEAAKVAGGESLKKLAADIEAKSFVVTNRSLSGLLAGTDTVYTVYPADTRATLQSLLTALVERGAILAGLLCYLSVVNQVQAGLKHAIISLDSSMARHFPGYHDGMQRTLGILSPSGVILDLRLVSPLNVAEGIEVSVPLQGAAASLSHH